MENQTGSFIKYRCFYLKKSELLTTWETQIAHSAYIMENMEIKLLITIIIIIIVVNSNGFERMPRTMHVDASATRWMVQKSHEYEIDACVD